MNEIIEMEDKIDKEEIQSYEEYKKELEMLMEAEEKEREDEYNKLFKKSRLTYKLNDLLDSATRKSLLLIGNNLGLKGLSKLKKEELVEKLVSEYSDATKGIIKSFDNNRYASFKEFQENKWLYKDEEINKNENNIIYYMAHGLMFPINVDGEKMVVVPEEFQEIFKEEDKIGLEDLVDENDRLLTLFNGMCCYYGVINLDDAYELVKRYYDEIPVKKVIYKLFTEFCEYYGLSYYSKEIFINSLVEDPIVIQKCQEEYEGEYRLLKADDLIEPSKGDYIIKNENYYALSDFIKKWFKTDDEVLEQMLSNIYLLTQDESHEVAFAQILKWFEIEESILKDELSILVKKYMRTIPLWKMKGNIQNSTVVIGEKIGRNDPCTCGSGKKYKKCCGK